jgi:hypothetical protein
MKSSALAFSAATLTVLTMLPAMGQQMTGTPGSPNATTTIDGEQLPPPDAVFRGVIADDALKTVVGATRCAT